MGIATVTTAEQLLDLKDDGFRYELVRGELRKMSPAGHEHGRITVNVTASLFQHVKSHDLGAVYAAETGFVLATDPDLVRAPDAAFIRRERVAASGHEEGFWRGAPDLAIEVISPSDTYIEVEEKVGDWLEAGTRMVVVVNPRTRSARVYHARDQIQILTEDDSLDGGAVVPGWTLRLREVFL